MVSNDQKRFLYHARVDPQLQFFVRKHEGWIRIQADEVTEETISLFEGGLVVYPSGEALMIYGAHTTPPAGVHFMSGPQYSDSSPGFDRRLVKNGKGGIRVWHSDSLSQDGDPQKHYATSVKNLTDHAIRATKFAPFPRGMFGIKREPNRAYYSPIQFRDWFRVENPDGWIQPGETVTDPDNYGLGNGVWAYFFQDETNTRLIATAPLGRDIR